MGIEQNIMRNIENKNKGQTRREFLKNMAKTALLVAGGSAL